MSTRATATQSPSAPAEPQLREAALRHLARYAATQAMLLRVLERRIERWRRAAPEEDRQDAAQRARLSARRVVDQLAHDRVLDDAAYATARARSLLRAGRSVRTVAAHLLKRGIDAEIVRDATPDDPEHEQAAALLLLRKRRRGPYLPGLDTSADQRRRTLSMLARAGFSHATATAALQQDQRTADALIERLRRQ